MTAVRREPAFLGMPPFPEAAHHALADRRLRAELRDTSRTSRSRRAEAVDELPPFVWEKLRRAGAVIKDDVIARLPDHLEELEGSVVAAGGTVHWARDADEANALVIRIAREHAAAEVVGVPAATTRETGLDDALADAGIRVRATAAANAGLTVRGADFAIAETGTVCAVDADENGLRSVTLPDVLVTVLGLEQVLPAWRDLEVFLHLLPRASTGERMSPYVSLWTGVTDDDGPRGFHLILLDNGRSDVLADRMGRQALRCIRCSACLDVCPVYTRVGGQAYGSVPPGPIGAILAPQLRGVNRHDVDAQTASLPYASTLCGACFEACPVRIDIPAVLAHQRAQLTDLGRGPARHREKAAMSAARWGLAEPWRLGLAQHAAALGRHVIARMPHVLAGPLARWTDGRDAPAPPPESFRTWFKRTNGGLDEGGSRDEVPGDTDDETAEGPSATPREEP
ncbi:LUD domain-containing protein [Yinghuangia sp. ASG 101]|uniref:LUD domain-containing protein n=1 Tax=Yinghuangia sp. ASG 101 TaxID=2896848 RepID=UPI001E4453C8|nr:LUD domain-containing protein [Yinghuangia sp. ASG 101]UGQ09396.1 LUD domain-containing protein [Yinghuangia sp. ASG 101]